MAIPPGTKEGNEIVKMILLRKLAKRETGGTAIDQILVKKGVDFLNTPLTAE